MEITTDLNEIKICHTVTVGEQKFSDPNQVMQEMIRQDVIQREVRHRTRAKHEKDYEDPRIFFQENFIRLNKKQQEVNTCIVPVKILMREGERYELSFGEIKRRAKKYGLVPCPQEVPIALGFLSKEPSELSNYFNCDSDKSLAVSNWAYQVAQVNSAKLWMKKGYFEEAAGFKYQQPSAGFDLVAEEKPKYDV